MKTYKIGAWEEQGGYLYIRAVNKKDAIEKVREYVNEYGLVEPNPDTGWVKNIKYVDITHREAYPFESDVRIEKKL